ncbi:MAG: radical SAM protein, partial [Gammaproteobacteria bacterium]|nr:radical SAM protein [Gammaproteobacteria bacterium]
MSAYPEYIEPLFRPPSEAESLILQVTNGCSWNRCTYCDMYTAPQKKFSLKKADQVFAEIERAAQAMPFVRRIFLADGDAMVLSTRRLLAILQKIQQHFPDINRVSAYCLPSNLKNKSVDELKELKQAGLALAYIGAESGDDELLRLIEKGETFESTVEACQKLQQAGIKTSVMIINGLGGDLYTQQHAINSARLVNECQPNYLATLVLGLPTPKERFLHSLPQHFQLLEQMGLFKDCLLYTN